MLVIFLHFYFENAYMYSFFYHKKWFVICILSLMMVALTYQNLKIDINDSNHHFNNSYSKRKSFPRLVRKSDHQTFLVTVLLFFFATFTKYLTHECRVLIVLHILAHWILTITLQEIFYLSHSSPVKGRLHYMTKVTVNKMQNRNLKQKQYKSHICSLIAHIHIKTF